MPTDLEAAEFATYERLESSHWWFRARRAVLRTFLQEVPGRQEKTILEIGCGSGGNLRYLFGDFKSRVGLEYNRHARPYAQQKLRLGDALVAGDANELPFRKHSFDCVALLDVLCHKAVPDVDHVLEEVRAVLKPGGYLLISDGAYDFLSGRHNVAVGAVRRFTNGRLRSHVERSGFGVLKISYWGVLVFAGLLAKRTVFERLVRLVRKRGIEGNPLDLVTVPLLDQILFASVKAEVLFLGRAPLPFGASICLLAALAQSDPLSTLLSLPS